MVRFILQRLLQGLAVLFVLLTLTFFLVRQLDGSPFTQERALPAHVLEELKAAYGLDRGPLAQYGAYLAQLARGELGPSFKRPTRRVAEIIAQSFPVSFTVGVAAMGLALAIGIPAGVLAAVRRNRPSDWVLMAVALLGICLPTFVIGPALVAWLSLKAGLLPVSGWGSPGQLVLPAITLALPTAAYLARLTRGGMLEVLSQDFIRTARAKGLPESTVVIRHALRGGLVPAVAFIGPAFAAILSGSFVIETIFQLPGMGQHFVNAPGDRDYMLLQGIVLFYGLMIVLANLASDLLQFWLDPRSRASL
jgi:oligopeptide transport system permease protein